MLGKDRDVRLDIAGGSQIPKAGAGAAESARILAELRKSWHGVERLLLAYDGSPLSADFLDTVMSFLDPAIAVTLIDVAEDESAERRHRRPDRGGQATSSSGASSGRASSAGRSSVGSPTARPARRSSGPPSKASSTPSS